MLTVFADIDDGRGFRICVADLLMAGAQRKRAVMKIEAAFYAEVRSGLAYFQAIWLAGDYRFIEATIRRRPCAPPLRLLRRGGRTAWRSPLGGRRLASPKQPLITRPRERRVERGASSPSGEHRRQCTRNRRREA